MKKYAREQKLYFIKQKSIPTIINCPTCEGEGELVKAKSLKRVKCPECNGKKTVSNSGSIKYVVYYGIVQKIVIEIDENIEIRYHMHCPELGSRLIFMEDELFQNLEVAMKECEVMNSNCLMGYTS